MDIIYKRDALKLVTEIYQDFTSLLSTLRGNNELYRSYESRFNARKAKLATHGTDLSLHESVLAVMLLSNAGIDDAHRIQISALAVGKIGVDQSMSKDQIIKSIKYETMASILRRCDTASGQRRHEVLSSNSSNFCSSQKTFNLKNYNEKPSNNKSSGYKKQKMTPEQFSEFRKNAQCST